eukprot:TRINITY_DN8583_c0_g1_i1.p1 TRINITY_DN8583_c0_g1~~TRINITY_DN8583_c0_g1_i1.p1  ORF type:complete len:128 (+),score=13.90 TRINITY_DN8583_c0_g1_i1:40-423(+)
MEGPLTVYIQRDYSHGTTPCFKRVVPDPLKGKIPEDELLKTIDAINALYKEAETPTTSLYCFNCFACLLGNLPLLCFENPYEEYFRRVTALVEQRNASVFAAHGLKVIDPLRRGLRVLELQYGVQKA